MKLTVYIYPGGPSLNAIQEQLDTLTPPLSEPIKKQASNFATQILDRINNLQLDGNPHHFSQSQTISDNNHTILLRGQMSPPSFWQTIFGRSFG